MSVRVMTQVWSIALPDSEKLVLLALADCANDEGGCWPSMKTLASKCSKSDRTIQGAIKSLVEKGHLSRLEVLGKGCSYTVHPRKDCGTTPEAASPPKSLRPEAPSPPKGTTQTPEAASDKPSRTVIGEGWEARAREIVLSPEWRAFAAMRRQIRKPLNPTGEKRILAKLKALDDAGYPPGEVLEQSTANCWQGVFKLSEEMDDGRRRGANGLGRNQPDDGRSATTRAAEFVFGRTAPASVGH